MSHHKTQLNFTQMSLAANDAFSLGLAHNGPRRRSLSRSSSPKISTAALFSQSTQGKGRENIRRRMIRRLSNLSSISPEAIAELQDHNGDLKAPSRKDVKPPLTNSPKKRPTPVDWEIPRKTLHSSIGMSLLFFALVFPFDRSLHARFPHHLSLCISWIPKTRRLCIMCCPRRSHPR